MLILPLQDWRQVGMRRLGIRRREFSVWTNLASATPFSKRWISGYVIYFGQGNDNQQPCYTFNFNIESLLKLDLAFSLFSPRAPLRVLASSHPPSPRHSSRALWFPPCFAKLPILISVERLYLAKTILEPTSVSQILLDAKPMRIMEGQEIGHGAWTADWIPHAITRSWLLRKEHQLGKRGSYAKFSRLFAYFLYF